jgi:hypothetical protein
MRRLIVLTAAAAATLVLAGSAGAVTLVSPQGQPVGGVWQQWTDHAQVPTWNGTLPFTVMSDLFDCGGMQAAGCSNLTPTVDQTTSQIMPQGTPLASVSTEIYNDPDPWQAKATLYHELGQVFWAEYLTTSDEARFMQIVGLGSDTSQWGNWLYGTTVRDGATYHFPPFEWFAEGYRYCAQYGINQPHGVTDEEGLFYPGDQTRFAPQQRQVCQLIDRVGLDNGVSTPAQTPAHVAKPKARRVVPPPLVRWHGWHGWRGWIIHMTRGRREVW